MVFPFQFVSAVFPVWSDLVTAVWRWMILTRVPPAPPPLALRPETTPSGSASATSQSHSLTLSPDSDSTSPSPFACSSPPASTATARGPNSSICLSKNCCVLFQETLEVGGIIFVPGSWTRQLCGVWLCRECWARFHDLWRRHRSIGRHVFLSTTASYSTLVFSSCNFVGKMLICHTFFFTFDNHFELLFNRIA